MAPVHPITKAQLSPLERELWRLRMIAHETQVLLRGFKRTGDVAKVINSELLFVICNHGLLLVTKFLEIWDDLGSLAKTDVRVVDARRAVQPLLDRIHVWPGLKRFRNTAIAHPYMTKDNSGELIGPWELLASEEAPSFHAEMVLLVMLIQYAVLGVLSVFEAEYLPLRPILASAPPTPGPGPGISLGTEIKPAIRALVVEVDAHLAKIGITVRGELAKEFFDAVEKL